MIVPGFNKEEMREIKKHLSPGLKSAIWPGNGNGSTGAWYSGDGIAWPAKIYQYRKNHEMGEK
jgi:hypothetical protein